MLCVKPIILPRKMQIMDEMLLVQRAKQQGTKSIAEIT
jgi:SET domain-containing protein